MASSSCPELSLRVESGPDSPFEFKWSSNRADYRHGSTLQNLDDTDSFSDKLGVGLDLNSLVDKYFDNIQKTSRVMYCH